LLYIDFDDEEFASWCLEVDLQKIYKYLILLSNMSKPQYKPKKGFNVRLESRIKNASLIGAREMAGLTIKKASQEIGVHYSSYCGYETMRLYPSEQMQKKICDFYRNLGIFLLEESVFPKELHKVKLKRKQITEGVIPKEDLISLSHIDRKLLPYFDGKKEIESYMLKEELDEALSKLPYREEQIIRMRFQEEKSLDEIGRKFSITRERVRQIEAKALMMLKHPTRSKELREFLEDFLK